MTTPSQPAPKLIFGVHDGRVIVSFPQGPTLGLTMSPRDAREIAKHLQSLAEQAEGKRPVVLQ